MTKEELRTVLIQNGVSTTDYEKIEDKVDVSKITEIVEEASNPEEAFEALHAFNPALEVEQLQKQCEFVAEQVRESTKQNGTGTIELTDQELDSVSGGGLFDWFSGLSSTWKGVVVGVAVGAVCVIALAGVGVAVGVGLAVKGAALAGAVGATFGGGTAGTVAAVAGAGIVGSAMTGFGLGVAAGIGVGGIAGAVTTAVTLEK